MELVPINIDILLITRNKMIATAMQRLMINLMLNPSFPVS